MIVVAVLGLGTMAITLNYARTRGPTSYCHGCSLAIATVVRTHLRTSKTAIVGRTTCLSLVMAHALGQQESLPRQCIPEKFR